MTAERPPLAEDVVDLNANYHFRWEEAQGAYVLLYPEGIVKLNATAAEIIEICIGGCSIADIAAQLSDRYGGEDVRQDVLKFMEVAHAKGWIRIKS
jgi:pyrroloquinoline quinone biosynthesis protein D